MSGALHTDADHARWRPWLERAARLAMRGHGNVEPNPMVGCVILDSRGELAGEGYHRKYGAAHAEVEALRSAGSRARGGTAIVTLEPCNHFGKTGPCSTALQQAGIVRVIYACSDPNGSAAGGAASLAAAGIDVLRVPCRAAELVTAPFLHTVRSGLPWVCVKWAQTLDGRLAASRGDSRWISGERSRGMVHRERGRVDAILTGMGTVLADDPLLTPRNVAVRRVPMRVVWDPRLGMPLESKLVRTARETPLVIATTPAAAQSNAAHAHALRNAGATVAPAADVRAALQWLHAECKVSTLLVEAGGGLIGHLLAEGLVNEAWVFVAPFVSGDASAPRLARESARAADSAPFAEHSTRLDLISVRTRGADVLIHYRVPA